MDINEQFRRNVRAFYAWVGSTLLLGIGPIVAHRLLERETTAGRLLAVIVGAGSMVPWMWVLISVIRRGDEFVRRLHLVSIAIAGAASLFLLVVLDWIQQARFIRSVDLTFLWSGCLLLWFLALIGTKRYYERER